jgi:hypothetical protein
VRNMPTRLVKRRVCEKRQRGMRARSLTSFCADACERGSSSLSLSLSLCAPPSSSASSPSPPPPLTTQQLSLLFSPWALKAILFLQKEVVCVRACGSARKVRKSGELVVFFDCFIGLCSNLSRLGLRSLASVKSSGPKGPRTFRKYRHVKSALHLLHLFISRSSNVDYRCTAEDTQGKSWRCAFAVAHEVRDEGPWMKWLKDSRCLNIALECVEKSGRDVQPRHFHGAADFAAV